MRARWLRRSSRMAVTGFAVGLALGAGMLIGSWMGAPRDVMRQDTIPLHAIATHGSDEMAIATGPISDNMEGLITLDYLTGEMRLYCLSEKVGKFILASKYNVLVDLKVERGKKVNLLLATGGSQYIKGGAALQPAMSTIYVCDANSGRFCAYGVQYNATAYKSAAPSEARIVLLDAGTARDIDLGE